MSKTCFTYLQESPLFSEDLVNSDYADFGVARLELELGKYREYVDAHVEMLQQELVLPDEQRGVFLDARRQKLASEDLIKQIALYVDAATLDDPLYRLWRPQQQTATALNRLLGTNDLTREPREVAGVVRYMKRLTSSVASGFARFAPLSRMHEPPDPIPLTLSEDHFADALPKPVLEWFRKRANVAPLTRLPEGWAWHFGEPLKPCRAIVVSFAEDADESFLYYLPHHEIVALDDDTRTLTAYFTFPDTPPEPDLFEAWVFQSVNQSARSAFRAIARDVACAAQTGSLYLTSSKFATVLLKTSFAGNEDPASLLFSLNVPVIRNVSLDDIMRVRVNHGECFDTFRRDLQRRLAKWSQLSDPEELSRAIRSAEIEMGETVVRDIDTAVDGLRRSAFADATLAAASLGLTVQGSGLSVLALAYAVAAGYRTWNHYRQAVGSNPAAFLWRLSREAERGKGALR